MIVDTFFNRKSAAVALEKLNRLELVSWEIRGCMIITTIKIHCLPQKRREIIQTIKGLTSKISKDVGCNKANFYQDVHNQDIFYLMEEWQSMSALELHKKSKSYAILFGLEALLVESLEIKHGIQCKNEEKVLGGVQCE